ncbi:MAG TPA: thiamine-phosphate kinase, partial [Lacipirellulaceae bacterium]|nr:thiamine-phosphate kinase [Lacipirellulaceae bacterium]
LAAMAAEPVAALVTLVLPKDGALDLAVGVFRGLLPLAERFEVAIAGGDTNVWDGPLVVSITAMGRTTSRGPLLRSGARPGDILLVTGAVGGSILGRHLAPEPRVREALALHAKFPLRAAMDVSDGLAIDAARLADASHCGVALDLAAIPIAEDARRLAASTHRTPLDHALGDGEDFELLLAADPTTAAALVAQPSPAVPLTAIGKFVDQPGLWQQLATGKLAPQEPVGYQH